MLVVPLVGIIIYATFPLIIFGLLRSFQWDFINMIYTFFGWVEKTLIELLLKIVYISESIPLAQISGKKNSFIQLVLLLLIIYSFVLFLTKNRARLLIISLTALLLFQITITYENLTLPAPQLAVFNNPGRSEIAIYHKEKRHFIDIQENSFIPHPEKSILLISETDFSSYDTVNAVKPFPLDVLILSQQEPSDIEQLLALFSPKLIVLDSSLPKYASKRIERECVLRSIKVHDVTEKGAFSLKF